jgi:1-acyl-sn-glycerol-3-phosphate acyltransferase
LAPTHASHLDFWSICLALPPGIRRKLYIAAATDHFYARWGWGLATRLLSYHNFAFNRHAQGTTEFKRLLRILQAGYSLLLFPQGSRMREGKWAPFKPWVARLAIASGVPVLSVGLAGTDRALPPGARWPRTAAIRVEFGPALPPPLAAQGQWGEVVRREALDRYAGAINQNAYELWQRAQEKIPA